MSVKILVKNNTYTAYSIGRIYMDDFYIYDGDAPVHSGEDLELSGSIKTYLNKQFTSIFNMGRAHGISGFDKEITSVADPSEENRSICIGLGAEAALMPLEESIAETFVIKAVYKSNSDISLMAKDKNGKMRQIAVLPSAGSFTEFSVTVDMINKKAVGSDGSETNFELD